MVAFLLATTTAGFVAGLDRNRLRVVTASSIVDDLVDLFLFQIKATISSTLSNANDNDSNDRDDHNHDEQHDRHQTIQESHFVLLNRAN